MSYCSVYMVALVNNPSTTIDCNLNLFIPPASLEFFNCNVMQLMCFSQTNQHPRMCVAASSNHLASRNNLTDNPVFITGVSCEQCCWETYQKSN